MAVKNTANVGFQKQKWDAACVLWGHIPVSEHRNVIIGLLFLKYISTAFDKKYQQLIAEGDGFGDDESIIKCVRGVYGIFIEKDGNRTCEYVGETVTERTRKR